jgi:hypothetical protein
MGPVTTKFARIDPGPSRTFGVMSALVAVIGAVLVVVAFTAVDWFDSSMSLGHFSDVRSLLDAGGSLAYGPAKVYFDWLGWVLLGVAFVTALLAAVPTLGAPFRIIAPIVAAGGIVMTFLSVKLVRSGALVGGLNEPSYGRYLSHAGPGFYLAVAGFLLMGIAGALGPQRARS